MYKQWLKGVLLLDCSFVFYHVAEFFACVHLIIVFNGMHNMACPWDRNVLFLFDLKNFVYCWQNKMNQEESDCTVQELWKYGNTSRIH